MIYIWTFGIIQKKFIEFEKKFKMVLKKMRRKEVISFSVGRAINSLLYNLRRRVWIASSITFVKIVYYCVIKYQSSLNFVVTFLIKTITQWPPLYVSRNYLHYILKLLQKGRTCWSNSPFPFVINNYFPPLLYRFSLTPTMMKRVSEFFNEIHVEKLENQLFTIKLWSNNEQYILQILIMQLMGTSEP